MKETAAVFGRFQPLHKGHLCVFEQMDQTEDVAKIIIGVGSSQYHHMLNNPFTFKEREEMLRASLNLKKPYRIIPIPDINDYPKWVAHVESLTPKFQVVYTGKHLVKRLFEEKYYVVRSVDNSYPISASKIRKMMITGGNWQEHLPQGVLEVVTKIKGSERLRGIYCEHLRPDIVVDAIVDYTGLGFALILREGGAGTVEGDKWALPGGHLETGQESVEEAVVRELEEETSLLLTPDLLHFFGQYSHPQRDPRHHKISLVFWAEVSGYPLKAGDDAQNIKIFPYDRLPENLAFDHAKIIGDYLKRRYGYDR